MRHLTSALVRLAGILCLYLIATMPAQAELKVVTSLKPIHSLTAAVMGKTGTPYLLVTGAASPHDYQLKPSDAAVLQEADIVFWIGAELERFLKKPLETIPAKAKIVPLSETPELLKLPYRGDEDLAKHEEHDGHADEHAHEHAHEHAGLDMHLWLNPDNAVILVDAIRQALSHQDRANAALYRANAERVKAQITRLSADIESQLQPLRQKQFIVFHDGYQYFEQRYGLTAAAIIALNPEVSPGAGRIREIKAKISELGAVCVFSESQFSAKIIALVTEATSAKIGLLDPLGTAIPAGPQHYAAMMHALAGSFQSCLSD